MTHEASNKETCGLNETIEETQERLRLAYGLVADLIATRREDLPVSVLKGLKTIRDVLDIEQYMLDEVREILKPVSSEDQDKIIISCDASITRNPGGRVAVGVVIRFPPEDKLDPIKLARCTPSSTNNEGEYDAVYEGLVHLFNTHNRPKHEVVIRSDSKLVVNQLLGEWNINNDTLQRKCDSIHELVANGPVPVQIEWKPRNSTPDLTEANFLAQDELGVRRH